MRSGFPHQEKVPRHVCCLSVLTPILCPLGTQDPSCFTAVLVVLTLRLFFPLPCAFSHDIAHKKGSELISASYPAHWDNYGFGVNVTPGCGQTWDLPAGLDAELQGEPLWRNQARSKSASALKHSYSKDRAVCM